MGNPQTQKANSIKGNTPIARARVCKVCSGPVEVKAKGRPRETCSDACRQALFRRQHPHEKSEAIARIDVLMRACEHCKTLFPQVNPKKRYCSDKCRLAHWLATHRKCVLCGNRFAVNPRFRETHRFCSRACQKRAWEIPKIQAEREERLAKLAQRPCEGCGGRIELKPNSPRHKRFCNTNCSNRYKQMRKRRANGIRPQQSTLPVRSGILPERTQEDEGVNHRAQGNQRRQSTIPTRFNILPDR
jgi:hypothetical protein